MSIRDLRIVFPIFCVLVTFAPARSQDTVKTVNASDFLGSIKESVYSNSYFRFHIAVPKDWQMVDADDKEKAERVASELIRERNETNGANYNPPKFNTVSLLHLKKKKLGEAENALFRIAATKQPNSTITSLVVAKISREKVLENPFASNVSELSELTINGRKFVSFDYSVNSNSKGPLRNFYYSTVVRGYSIAFIISFFTEDDGKQLQTLVQTVVFK